MISKLLFFRPDRRFVNDADLEEKYTCLVKDEFTGAESLITVPAYLTVFQHHIPKACRKAMKSKNLLSLNQFREKMCFYVVGSKQAPLLTEFSSNTQNVDRIEFKGLIGFETPIFDILNQLPELRKVSFVITPCTQKHFIADFSNKKLIEDDQCEEESGSKNLLVTNLKIIFQKCSSTSCCCSTAVNDNHRIQEIVEKNETDGDFDINNHLETMITQLLSRMVKQCPNIKRLYMDVPDFEGVRKAILNSVKRLTGLKPTKISYDNGNIRVRKNSNDLISSDIETPIPTPTPCKETNSEDETNILKNSPSKQESEAKLNADKDEQTEDNKTKASPDEPEVAPCLFDMSKLLGSMLGIPTSSFPPGFLPHSFNTANQQQIFTNTNSDDDTVVPPQNCNNFEPPIEASTTVSSTEITTASDCPMNSTASNTNQSITAASPSLAGEVITYAAAAASAATTIITTSTPNNIHHRYQQYHHYRHHRLGGNDNGHHHHPHHHRYHHHHINEGSRTAFLRDGEGTTATTAEEESNARNAYSSINNKKKPSFPHVADLGKPVFISSTSCKSPRKRGV